jgi:hypothetical protein
MTINYNPGIVTSGLVFYVDAANPRSYSGTGTTWKDLSGNGLDLTMQGSVIWNSTGYFNNWSTANYFARTNSDVWSYVPLGDTARTVIAFAEMGSISGYQHVLHYGNGGVVNQTYGIATLTGNVSDHRWGTSNIGTNTLVTGSRYMLSNRHSAIYTGVRQGVNLTYQDITTITTAATASGQFRVGLRAGPEAEPWPADGKIYTVMIYNRALTDDEMSINFQSIRSRYGI